MQTLQQASRDETLSLQPRIEALGDTDSSGSDEEDRAGRTVIEEVSGAGRPGIEEVD